MRLKSFSGWLTMVLCGTAVEQEVQYTTEGDLVIKKVDPEQVQDVLAKLRGETRAAEDTKASKKETKPAETKPPAKEVKPAETKPAPQPELVTGVVGVDDEDSNPAWGIDGKLAPELAGAAVLSVVLRYLMGKGVTSKADLVANCTAIKQRFGEACAPLHKLDIATLPDRIDRFLAAVGA